MRQTKLIGLKSGKMVLKDPVINIPNTQAKALAKVYDCIGIQELEIILRNKITEYQANAPYKEKGYRTISALIEQKMVQFLKSENVNEEEIYKIVKNRVPSSTYIADFHKGRNICINYMNSLAYLYDVKYLVHNFGWL
jgi:hypothetical protein